MDFDNIKITVLPFILQNKALNIDMWIPMIIISKHTIWVLKQNIITICFTFNQNIINHQKIFHICVDQQSWALQEFLKPLWWYFSYKTPTIKSEQIKSILLVASKQNSYKNYAEIFLIYCKKSISLFFVSFFTLLSFMDQ